MEEDTMLNRSFVSGLLSVVTALATSSAAFAEDHADTALKHANEAADSTGDSQSIRQHASEALKHIHAAKIANAHRPEVVEHLEKGESELRDAIEHASHYNATTAGDTAFDAQSHLESARDAAVKDQPVQPANR
jgi:hypothetical protein